MFISLRPQSTLGFESQLNDLFLQLSIQLKTQQLDAHHVVCTRLFFSDIINQRPLLEAHPLYVECLSYGAVSMIEQPPLDGAKINVLIYLSSDALLQKEGDATLRFVSKKGVRHLFHSVRLTSSEIAKLTVKQQTLELFRRHHEVLKKLHLSMANHCIRTWIYVRDIDHNYADVVAARNQVFGEYGLSANTHFIASTGIGGEGADPEIAVCMDFYSVDAPHAKVKYLTAPDYLNATMEYGVAFERGTSLTIAGKTRLFISGTASIDKHGECLHRGKVEKQLDRLFLNINQLLKDGGSSLADVEHLLVYIRDIADYQVVANYLHTNYSSLPTVILLARVCRPEWLVEIECTASFNL
ncbi:MAG: Rid family hydrolase [Bacteroidaceae bacterium]